MSEYRSLYINIRIKEEELRHFFGIRPKEQLLDDNWKAWWDSGEMYRKQPLTEIPIYTEASNRAVFDKLLADKDVGAMEQYDAASGSWIFISVFFTENYTEILPMLVLSKSMAAYQDVDEKGVALI